MSKANHQLIRKQISSDLISLSSILRDRSGGVFRNPEVLTSAANEVERFGKDNEWRYEVPDLIFSVAVPQGVVPRDCGSGLDVKFNLSLKGSCLPSGDDDGLIDLILDLEISSPEKGYICAWHFDRHIGKDGDNVTEAHPLYHFQHGGKALAGLDDIFGMSLMLPAPRLPFPPMDAILAIDFVLSNFSGDAWNRLRNDTAYLRLLRSAQLRFWKPYMVRLATWWAPGPKSDAWVDQIFPHLA